MLQKIAADLLGVRLSWRAGAARDGGEGGDRALPAAAAAFPGTRRPAHVSSSAQSCSRGDGEAWKKKRNAGPKRTTAKKKDNDETISPYSDHQIGFN